MTLLRTSSAGVTRRTALGGIAAAAGLALTGGRAFGAVAPEGLTEIFARSGLGALSGFALADAGTGALIEAHQPDIDRPPASTAKIVTALYALDALGEGHRFETRLVAAGPVSGGAVAGDLALVGGGDPLLDTDALGDLLAEARDGGLASVSGRLVVAAGALPAIAEIAPDQPAEAGYNPAISGLNLNFNRAHLAWKPGADGPVLTVSAPGERFQAPAPGIVARLGPGPLAVALEDGREVWTLPADRLPGRGSIWLPVRRPPQYAGAAFRGLAAQAGLALPAPEAVAVAPGGLVLARRTGPPLRPLLRDLLRYSTNLTAEAAGLTASRARGAPATTLAASAGEMTRWARARYGLARSAFVNHSGLSPESAMTPTEMVRVLVASGGIGDLLRERPLRDGNGDAMEIEGVRVVAKTGTLDFVSALAGYVEVPGGRRRAFAIFAADLEARARILPSQRSDPPGAAAWARRARAQEMALLRRWIAQDPGDALARTGPRARPAAVAAP